MVTESCLQRLRLDNMSNAAVTGTLACVAVAVAVGTASLRNRLYDIDRIINRTLVYGCSPPRSLVSTPSWS